MPKPSLCLNMIVKNEADRIERCLASVLPHVKAVLIVDTGSVDDTVAIIKRLCATADVGCAIKQAPFIDFSQARNVAFAYAQEWNGMPPTHWCQFALMADADMELVVTDPHAFDNLDANALSYDMMQKGGSVSYGNRRIINLEWGKPPYTGVTHEYIDVPTAGMIAGASFVDHADGSNRANKYVRDAQLLEDALKTEPDNGRYWYYLGNTYRDWGATDTSLLPYAAHAYRKRIALGGWEEETHSAMMHLAGVQKTRGEVGTFVSGMVEAYSFRPSRAEPLYDLAKHYREKGNNAAALLFAKTGVDIKRSDDLLFVNDFVYSHGLRYEYAIAGYYDEKERPRALEVTNALALDPTCPQEYRDSARSNLFWYTAPIGSLCRSFKAKQIDVAPPPGYIAMNPSVTMLDGKIICNVRTVNYKIDEHGRYMIGPKECNDAAIDTRNLLIDLDEDLNTTAQREILWHRPPARFEMVTGLEDVRLWGHDGGIHFNATIREASANGTCQQIQGQITDDAVDPAFAFVSKTEIMSGEALHEKNWMNLPATPKTHSRPEFFYRLDTVITPGVIDPTTGVSADRVEKFETHKDVSRISGSSQAVPYRHGLLAVVHEAANGPDGKRTYWHRFAAFTRNGQLTKLSRPFVFFDRQIEFCAGLARHPNRYDMILSFGIKDKEAWVATMSNEDVAAMLWTPHDEN